VIFDSFIIRDKLPLYNIDNTQIVWYNYRGTIRRRWDLWRQNWFLLAPWWL